MEARTAARRAATPGRDGADTGFGEWLTAGPAPQRWGMRLLVALAGRPRGAALLGRLGPVGQLAGSMVALRRYDRPETARALGWDAGEVVPRGRALRRAEGRP